ncbi:hypothetical protein C8J56DRAFT_950723 [Mycena floridula]|nr:hypothetical protein C8J56DRAFT_950723 [Mycena floridula]
MNLPVPAQSPPVAVPSNIRNMLVAHLSQTANSWVEELGYPQKFLQQQNEIETLHLANIAKQNELAQARHDLQRTRNLFVQAQNEMAHWRNTNGGNGNEMWDQLQKARQDVAKVQVTNKNLCEDNLTLQTSLNQANQTVERLAAENSALHKELRDLKTWMDGAALVEANSPKRELTEGAVKLIQEVHLWKKQFLDCKAKHDHAVRLVQMYQQSNNNNIEQQQVSAAAVPSNHSLQQSMPHVAQPSHPHVLQQSASQRSSSHIPRQSSSHVPQQSSSRVSQPSSAHIPRKLSSHSPLQTNCHIPQPLGSNVPRKSSSHAPLQTTQQAGPNVPRTLSPHVPQQSHNQPFYVIRQSNSPVNQQPNSQFPRPPLPAIDTAVPNHYPQVQQYQTPPATPQNRGPWSHLMTQEPHQNQHPAQINPLQPQSRPHSQSGPQSRSLTASAAFSSHPPIHPPAQIVQGPGSRGQPISLPTTPIIQAEQSLPTIQRDAEVVRRADTTSISPLVVATELPVTSSFSESSLMDALGPMPGSMKRSAQLVDQSTCGIPASKKARVEEPVSEQGAEEPGVEPAGQQVPEEAPMDVQDAPVVEKEHVVTAEPVPEEPMVQEAPQIEVEPVVKEELAVKEEIKEEPTIKEEPMFTEEPVVEEAVMVEEQRLAEETPMGEEQQAVEAAPMVAEPVVEDEDEDEEPPERDDDGLLPEKYIIERLMEEDDDDEKRQTCGICIRADQKRGGQNPPKPFYDAPYSVLLDHFRTEHKQMLLQARRG